jgi:hypothetical protein
MTLETRDRAIVAMLAAFTVFNLTLDLALVVNARHLGERAGADWASALWAIYADADRLWIVAPWSLAQEGINVFWTSVLNVWLIWAIVTRRAYRHVLQLALGSYLSYSVILYWLAGHLSGYEGMRFRTAYAFLLFYGTSVPWLAAHLYMTYDSAVAITRRFANAAARPGG